MVKKIKIKIKKNLEIFSLILILLITATFTSYYNYNKKKMINTYGNLLENVYFKKSVNHLFNNLEPRFKKIEHVVNIGETFDKIMEQYSVNEFEIQQIKKELSRAKIQIKDPSVIDIVYGLSKDLEPGDFRNTLEKIYLYKFNDKSSLTAKDISACRPISAEANLDDMIYAVADGKTHKISAIFNRLKAQGVQPVTLCLSFQRHFKLLLRLSIYEGTQSEAISNQKPPIFGPRRNIILNQLKLWNVKNLKTALAYFVELDLGLRSISTQSPVEAITERTLIRVAMLAKP